MSTLAPIVSVLVPAFNAEARIGATVRAAFGLPGVEQVIVVDDGSDDSTAAAARQAGAEVVALPRNLGKGGALAAGIPSARGEIVLLLDADLGESAASMAPLLEAVRRGEADMAIARPPPSERRGGF